MLTRIKQWLEPPHFEGDEDKTNQTRIANTLIIYLGAALLVVIFILIPLFAFQKIGSWILAITIFCVLAVGRRLLFKGNIQLATELSDLPAETDLAAFTARKIKELTHSFAVTFSEYSPQKKQLENGKLITDSAIISRVNAVLEKKVDSLVYPVSDEMYLEIKQNRIGFFSKRGNVLVD